MIHLTFILDGGEMISADELTQRPLARVERVMLLVVRNHIRRKLGDLSCREHGQPPSIIASGPSPDQLAFSVEGCCQQLVDDATTALHAPGSLDLIGANSPGADSSTIHNGSPRRGGTAEVNTKATGDRA